MKALLLAAAIVGVSGYSLAQAPPSSPPAEPCRWNTPATRTTVRVRSIDDLQRALVQAKKSTTILIEPGVYRLDRTVSMRTPDVVLRGATGNPADVVLRGGGVQERQVGVAVSIDESGVTLADLTIRDVGFHGIQVRGENGVSRVVIHGVHIADTGQQLVKGSTDGRRQSTDVVVECSTFSYTTEAPSDYTNGVDVLGGTNWVIRDNRFLRIHGPSAQRFAAGPAILFWAHSIGTIIERNVIIDSFRGIALGLRPGGNGRKTADGQPDFDHEGGRIRNNVVINLHSWADEGIELNAATEVVIDHNTVLTTGNLPWAISLRFPQTKALVRNNLTSRPITTRDGGQGEAAGNVSGATVDWFVDGTTANLRLAHEDSPAIHAGVRLAEVPDDAAGYPRSAAATAGAFEYWKH